MGEYEPNDSRNVTLKRSNLPGEPERTGPREAEARDEGNDRQRELEREKVRQENLAKGEAAAGEPGRGFDQDEG